MKKQILTLLVLLMTAVTGAWAREQSETIVTTYHEVEGTHFTISNDDGYADTDGMIAVGGITVTPKNGETITKVVITCTYDPSHVTDGNTSVSSGTKEITNGGGTITVTGVNASTFTFTCSYNNPQFVQFVVYYTEASTGIDLTPSEGNKVWTLAEMPAYDVELEVEYYPGMLSLGGDAIEGGTVEVVGLTGDALPAGFEKDAEGNIYVAEGTTFTVKATPDEGYHFVCWSDDETNTNPEREITMPAGGSDLSLSATFAENEYDITFSEGTNPDPENPEWTATPNPAKTKQTVTVTYTGTKKVIGVKAEKKAAAAPVPGPFALNLSNPAVGQVIGSNGINYAYTSLPNGVTAVAKICYVSGNNGLALAMADENGKMDWGAANTAAAAHEPACTSGGTWRMANQSEWNNMINAAGGASNLRDGFSSVGGTNMQASGYWSTNSPVGGYHSWYPFGGSGWQASSDSNQQYVRACLAF